MSGGAIDDFSASHNGGGASGIDYDETELLSKMFSKEHHYNHLAHNN